MNSEDRPPLGLSNPNLLDRTSGADRRVDSLLCNRHCAPPWRLTGIAQPKWRLDVIQ